MEPFDPLSPLVEHAIELAAQWHDGTHRKSRWRPAPFAVADPAGCRVPVMAHLTAVAMAVQRAGWDEATVAAAFLHDALEDPNCHDGYLPFDALAALVGEAVASLVRDVTEPKFDASGNRLPWRHRKEAYLAHLRTAPAGAVAISLADKLHNLWTMNEALAHGVDIFTPAPGRKALSAGPADQRWFQRAVLEATRHHADPRLIPLRRRLTTEVERFESLTT